MSQTEHTRAPRHPAVQPRTALLITGIVLIAANLRAPLTAVGPLIGPIRQSLGLTAAEAGLLNTLPLLAFAAFSPIAAGLASRWGRQRLLWWALLTLSVGIVARSVPTIATLLIGTVVIGAVIAIGNVILPQVIRSHFPDRVATFTGVYVTVMGMVAAVASGVAVPIAGSTPAGWQTALGCWAGLALIAAAVWAPQLRRPRATVEGSAAPEAAARVRIPWRSALAWQVTAFMGLQSFGFYVMIAWLPSILQDRGFSDQAAGWALFGYQVMGLVASLTLPLVTRGVQDQRLVAVAAAIVLLVGYLGLVVAPVATLVWVALVGIGGGAGIVLALTFIALRAPDSAHTASLSGMAQSVGYLFAASGPILVGLAHGVTDSWTLPLLALGGTAGLLAIAGLGAGRRRHVACGETVRR